MIKILIISLLAFANCQNVIEIGSSPQRTGVNFNSGIRSYSGLSGLSGYSGLTGLGSFGRTYQVGGYSPSVSSYNLNAARPVAFSLGNYGLGSYGSSLGSYGIGNLGGYGLSSGLGSYGLSGYGLGVSQPQAYALVAIQPTAQQTAVVAAQPAAVVQQAPINYVSGGVKQFSFGQQSYGQQSQQVVPVTAAIQSTRTVEYRPVPYNDQPLVPQDVIVEASEIPLNIHFKSRSSTIQVSQSHEAGEPGTVETTQSQDEPSRVVHEVQKPVIQEVREIITPYRQVTQEVQPVVEQIHTIVARGEGVRQNYIAQQPIVQQQVQQVRQVQAVAQPVATFQAIQQPAISSFAIQQQPVAQFAVAQPVSVQAVQQQPAVSFAIAQPVQSYQTVQARPVSSSFSIGSVQPEVQSFSIGAVRPALQSYSFGVQQPANSLFQSVRSVQQPASVVSYSSQTDAQPAVSFRSGNVGHGGSVVFGRSASLPASGTASFSSYSSGNVANPAVDDDDSK